MQAQQTKTVKHPQAALDAEAAWQHTAALLIDPARRLEMLGRPGLEYGGVLYTSAELEAHAGGIMSPLPPFTVRLTEEARQRAALAAAAKADRAAAQRAAKAAQRAADARAGALLRAGHGHVDAAGDESESETETEA